MFIILSPAKTLDFENPLPELPERTAPRFLDASAQLVERLRTQSADDLAALMKVSDRIARLNVERFAQWQPDMAGDGARAAAFAFQGDVYGGLEIGAFDAAALQRAQQRLRILSGLYGLLRPLDRIRPYRLEMSTRLATAAGDNLYQFWGERLTRQLDADMEAAHSNVLVDLASKEYSRAVDKRYLAATTVTPRFEDEKNGRYKVISFHAKKARGLMAAWILQNNIADADGLAGFNVAGYQYAADVSSPEQPVFRRPEAA